MTAHPLHLVHVVRSNGFAGVERYIADTAAELHARGHRVEVVGGDVELMRGELPGGVRHHRGGSGAQVARALWRIGSCDIVHAHMTAAESMAALQRRRNHGAFVSTRHFAGRRGSSPFGRVAAPFIVARLDRQIAISEYVARSIGEPSVVIANGVRPSTCAGRPERENTVVVLQRLEPEKDTALAVRAWAASGLGRDGWRLLVHGRGRETASLDALIDELSLRDSVELGGFVDAPRKVLERAGLLLATAPAEPFGLTVVEGMAEGTAVVAADGGAHRETLGPHGGYFSPGDVAGCAQRLREFADRPAARAAAGQALRERHAELFTVRTHVDALLHVYGQVV